MGDATHAAPASTLPAGASPQISDIHVSRFRPKSTETFRALVDAVVPVVGPALVVVTGDLTDGMARPHAIAAGPGTPAQALTPATTPGAAPPTRPPARAAKDEHKVRSQQYEDEWATYASIVARTNVSWHDLRGNHDCFNVPSLDSNVSFFATYSRSRQSEYAFHHTTAAADTFAFVAVDAWYGAHAALTPRRGPLSDRRR